MTDLWLWKAKFAKKIISPLSLKLLPLGSPYYWPSCVARWCDPATAVFQHTVDGRNPANQLRLVVYPIIYRVLYIPGGAGFCPSTVVPQSWTSNIWIASSKSLKSFKLTWQKEFGKKNRPSRSIEIRIQDRNARAIETCSSGKWLSCSIGSYSQAKRNTLSHFLSGTQSTTFTAQDHGSTFMTCGWS